MFTINGEVKTDASGGPNSVVTLPAQELLSSLNCLRVSGDFCDVTLTVGGKNFPAHRTVLAGLTPYFKALFSNKFSESNEESIEIKSIDATTMSHLIEYGYGKPIEITLDNVQNLLHASNFLQFPTLFDECATFLGTNVNVTNCLSIYNLAKLYLCNNLAEKAKEYTLKNFLDVCKESEFLELDAESMIDFISSDSLNSPAENNEIDVFNAVIKWLSHKEKERTSDLCKILTEVRLAHMPGILLYDIVETQPVVRNSPECLRLLERAVKYHTVKNRRLELQCSMSKRRRLWSEVEVMLICAEKLNTGTQTRNCICIADDGRVVREYTLPAQGIESVNVSSSQLATYFVQWQTFYYLLSSQGSWKTINVTAHWFGITELDGFLFVIGGKNSEDKVVDSVVKYNMSSSSPSTLSPLPIPVYSPGIVTLRGVIYVVGGLDKDGGSKNALQRYDPRSNSWTLLAPLPTKRGEFKVCALNDRIYACEFFSHIVPSKKSEDSRTVYVYDPNADKWSSCARLCHAFVSGPVPCNGSIFVLTEKPDKERILEKYDSVSNTWKEFASFVGYRPYLIGGTLVNARPSTEYDPKGPLNFVRVLK